MKNFVAKRYVGILIVALALVFLVFGCATTKTTTTAPVSCSDFTGTWNTSQGPVEIYQNGCSAMGTFPSPIRFHSISGTVSGNSLMFSWEGPMGTGNGVLTISQGLDYFSGTWGYGSESSGGTIEGWKGTWPVK